MPIKAASSDTLFFSCFLAGGSDLGTSTLISGDVSRSTCTFTLMVGLVGGVSSASSEYSGSARALSAARSIKSMTLSPRGVEPSRNLANGFSVLRCSLLE